MTTKAIIAGAAGIALATAPFLALAHDTNGDVNVKANGFDKTTVSVSISDNGSTLVRGARVTDVDGDEITATTDAGGTTLTWRIDTDNDTDFVDASSKGSDLGDIDDGEYVSFSGTLEGSNLSVNADTVRDWSDGDPADDSFMGFWTNFKGHFPLFDFFGSAKGGSDKR